MKEESHTIPHCIINARHKDLWISHYKSMKFRLSTIFDNITVSFGLYKWTGRTANLENIPVSPEFTV